MSAGVVSAADVSHLVHAAFIREGDEWHFDRKHYWTAIGDARVEGDRARVEVQYADGGRSVREWHVDQLVRVVRPIKIGDLTVDPEYQR